MIPTNNRIKVYDTASNNRFNLVIEKLMIPTKIVIWTTGIVAISFQSRNRETYDSNCGLGATAR